MKPKDLSDAVGQIDEEILESADEKRAEALGLYKKEEKIMKQNAKRFFLPIGVMAACATLVIGAWALGYGHRPSGLPVGTDPKEANVGTEPSWLTAEPTGPVVEELTIGTDPTDFNAVTAPVELTDGTEPSKPAVVTEPTGLTVSTAPKSDNDVRISLDTDSAEPDPEEIAAEINSVVGGLAVEPLAYAEYPKAAPYPDESLIYVNGMWNENASERIYAPWSRDNRIRYDAAKKIPDISDFYNTTAQQFLTNSNGENRVYSPLSIYVCLAMLAETTDGNSRNQILKLLECKNIEALRENIYNIWMGNYRNDGATTSILANSIWLSDSIAYKKSTLNTLAEKYYASSFSGDMSKGDMTLALRAWLNLRTGGLLQDSVEQIKLDPKTVIALCNTVYFRAKWDGYFNKDKNEIKTFHSPSGDIETEFMNSKDDYGPYYWGNDYGAITLKFADSGYMWLILPDEDKTVDDVLNSGEYLDMVKDGWGWGNSKYISVNYSVPKFDVTCDTDLIDGLKELGITDVFDENKSDFSSLCDVDNVYVGQAKHSARVMIDEEGCTAAAFTAMVTDGAAMPPEEEIDFVLDRPFIFVIDNGSNQPLFTGVVNMPQQ